MLCPEVSKALSGVMLIAEQKKRLEESTKVSRDTSSNFEVIRKIIDVIRYTTQDIIRVWLLEQQSSMTREVNRYLQRYVGP